MTILGWPKDAKTRQREELVRIFEVASEGTATELSETLADASVSLRMLTKLDDSQRLLHKIILREQRVVKRDRDDLVSN